MRRLGLLILLCGTGLLSAAPPEVTPVPAPDPAKWVDLKVAANDLVVLQAEPASTWELWDETLGRLRTFENGKFGVLMLPDGRHKLVVTAPDNSKRRIVLVAGRTPDDDRKPPPADPLKAKLKAAFDSDADPKKSEHAKDLAALYREAGKLAQNPDVLTAADLLQRVRAASKTLVGDEALKGVRAAVGQELATLFAVDAPLEADQRKKASALFSRLAEILDGVGV